MPARPALRPAIDLVAELLVEAGGLEAERVQEHVAAAALGRAPLRHLHQALAEALAAQGLADPEDADEHDAAPGRRQEPPDHLVARIAEEEIDRRVLLEAGDRDVVGVQ